MSVQFIISAEGVTKTYEDQGIAVHANRGIDMTIAPGEFTAHFLFGCPNDQEQKISVPSSRNRASAAMSAGSHGLQDSEHRAIPSFRAWKFAQTSVWHASSEFRAIGRLHHDGNVNGPEKPGIVEPISQSDGSHVAESPLVEVGKQAHAVRFIVGAQDMVKTAAARPPLSSLLDACQQSIAVGAENLEGLIIFALFGQGGLLQRHSATDTDLLDVHVVESDHMAPALM